MLFGLLATLFVIVSIILILLVLVQNDKGGGLSSSIGGGVAGANSVIGSQNTENILTRGTTLFAILYFVLTMALSLGVSQLYGGEGAESALKTKAANTVNTYPVDGANALSIEQPQKVEVEEAPALAPVADSTK